MTSKIIPIHRAVDNDSSDEGPKMKIRVAKKQLESELTEKLEPRDQEIVPEQSFARTAGVPEQSFARTAGVPEQSSAQGGGELPPDQIPFEPCTGITPSSQESVVRVPEPPLDLALHPQLQTLLSYLADGERVTIVRGDMLNQFSARLDTLSRSCASLEQKIDRLTSSAPPSLPATGARLPAAPTLTAAPAPAPAPAAERWAEQFPAVYVLDLTGRAIAIAGQLDKLGLRNCVVIQSIVPTEANSRDRLGYYLFDALEHAQEQGYGAVLIVQDNVQVHKRFLEAYAFLDSAVRTLEWDILHFSSVDHRYDTPQPNDPDLAFYRATGCDLQPLMLDHDQRLRQHWNTHGKSVGRCGRAELLKTRASSPIAFAVRATQFDELRRRLIAARTEGHEFNLDFGDRRYLTNPNLFLFKGLAPQQYRERRWVASQYEG